MKFRARTLALTATALTMAIAPAMVAAQDAAPVDDEAGVGNDIIITASKRSQTLQDTPIAVSVTDAATIERSQVRDLNDLQTLVPSLRVGQLQSSANTNFIIRGFGNGANNAGIEPSVGVFIDGVYRSRSAAQIGDLPNLERVEVLRGPQSTLFGKNASAGIISIVTQEPQFEFGGSAEISYGNFDAIVGKANITGPISDTIAFSLSGNVNKRDGYVRNIVLGTDANERDRWGVRGQLLFEPNDDLKIRLIGDFDKIDEDCCGVVNIVDGPTGNIVRALGGQLVSNSPFARTEALNFASTNEIENYGGSAQIDYDLGALSFTSITAYRKVDAVTGQDSDFTSAELLGRNFQDLAIDTFTQEFRVASDFDGPLNFLLGGFYFVEDINQKNDLRLGADFRNYGDALIQGATGGALSLPFLETTFGALEGNQAKYTGAFFRNNDGLDETYTLDNKSWSVFGTVDFEVTDRLTLTAGGNFTRDRKNFTTNVISNDVFSTIDLDAPQFAPFRNQLLLGGGLAAQGVNPSDPAAVLAFATNPATAPIFQAIQAFANANDNNPAANPLAGLKAFQFLPPFLNVPNSVERARTRDRDFSYTLRAAYEVTDALNVYATYATGFKASSVNLSRDSRPLASDLAALTAANLTQVNQSTGTRFAGPEAARVIEAGIKGQFQGFAFNVAIFDQQLKGFQSNIFTGDGFVLSNAEKQSVQGVELDFSVSPVRNLTFTGAVTYLDSKFDLFTGGSAINPTTLTVVPTNLTGLTPAGIPDFSLTFGGNYRLVLTGDTVLNLNATFLHESNTQIAQGLPQFRREVNQLDASAMFELGNGLEVGMWGRNLTNQAYTTTLFPSVVQPGSLSGYRNVPRTWGGIARYRF